MTNEATLELTDRIARPVAVAAYPISIEIINKSSVGFQKAEVAVKDEGSGAVATAYFGHISSGGTAREVVQLPGGVEQCIWKILPDVGDEIYGYGLGNNVKGVRLTITD